MTPNFGKARAIVSYLRETYGKESWCVYIEPVLCDSGIRIDIKVQPDVKTMCKDLLPKSVDGIVLKVI